jgi:sulfite exporter TauE/SafE
MDMLELIGTGGAVAITMGILEAFKRMELASTKFIPIIELIVGMFVCWMGSAADVLPVADWAGIIWYGIMIGLMACGLFSGVKNTVK